MAGPITRCRRSAARLASWVLGCLVLAGALRAGPTEAPAPYPTDHQAPLDPAEKVVSKGAGFTRLRVGFNGVQGDRVPGFLYLPEGSRPRRWPAVLLQHGSGSDKTTPHIVHLAERLAAGGFVVLSIDAPGRGERAPKGQGRFALLLHQFSREMFLHYCGDYSRAVDYLATRPEVDPGRIAYAGVSWGAITGITFAAHDPRVRAVVSLVGGGGMVPLVLGTSPGPAREAALAIDPINQVGGIAPRPLLLLNARQDRLMPRTAVEELHRAAGKDATVVWVDTDHDFNGPGHDKVAQTVIQFLQEHLPAR